MNTPKFLHKRREFLGHKLCAFGGCVASYSAWKTVYVADSKERAKQSIDDHPKTGLWQHAIFHKGKKIEP